MREQDEIPHREPPPSRLRGTVLFQAEPFPRTSLQLALSGGPDFRYRRLARRAAPPVRRFADVVRGLVRSLDRLGFGGSEKIAQVLARAGFQLSARSFARIRKEEASPAPKPPTDSPSPPRVLRAKHPNHVLADITLIPGRLRLFHFRLALVLDVFSRMPLAWRVFYFKPSAGQMARLFQSALRRFGAPLYFVSDHGAESLCSLRGCRITPCQAMVNASC